VRHTTQGSCELLDIDLCEWKIPKLHENELFNFTYRGAGKAHDFVETAPQCRIEHFFMVSGSDNEAWRVKPIEQLQETIYDALEFAMLILVISAFSYRIELVEK
jgi:hypothetical protein